MLSALSHRSDEHGDVLAPQVRNGAKTPAEKHERNTQGNEEAEEGVRKCDGLLDLLFRFALALFFIYTKARDCPGFLITKAGAWLLVRPASFTFSFTGSILVPEFVRDESFHVLPFHDILFLFKDVAVFIRIYSITVGAEVRAQSACPLTY